MTPSPRTSKASKRDAELAAELGFDAAFVDETPLVGTPGVRVDGQARVHPRRYLAGLAKAIVAAGGRIHEHTGAESSLIARSR